MKAITHNEDSDAPTDTIIKTESVSQTVVGATRTRAPSPTKPDHPENALVITISLWE